METIIIENSNLEEIVNLFKNDNCVAIATDTVFGLGCIYDSEIAINKIKKAKGRDEHKPLPMMCSNLEMIKKVAILSDEAIKVIEKLTPGALTLILKKKEDLPAFVNNGFDTIAIRIPNNELLLKLMNSLNKPILMTSANISNEPSLKYFDDVYNSLNTKIDAIVKGDALSEISSTIVDMTDDLKILREGIITKEMIEKAIKEA